MENIIFPYISFLFDTVTVVVAITVVLLVFFGLIAKAKSAKQRGELKIKRLDEQFAEQKLQLQSESCSKKELKSFLKTQKHSHDINKKITKDRKRIFVIHFEGDIHASAVGNLKEEINTVLQVALRTDEILISIASPGGVVHGYGLAAAQLQRVKDRNIPLTVAVDKVAASGGYMMACVADKIIAAPFAIIGSIGVVYQLPNFHKMLTKHGIEFEQVTAGEYKRTLTLFGENSNKARKKAQTDVNNMHSLFKAFIARYRPNLDFKKVATGEYWYALDAQKFGLVDEIQTLDEYLLNLYEKSHAKLIEVKYLIKKPFSKRLTSGVKQVAGSLISRF